jgi:hypothetical protein|tara:strand:- start:902 stop:1012 length:111 start_codon:yes stop_codon:yes gene_type:complete
LIAGGLIGFGIGIWFALGFRKKSKAIATFLQNRLNY